MATQAQRRELQSRLDELWDFDDPAASEARFRAALAEGREFAADGWRRDVVRTQLARSLGLQRRFDEGLAELHAVQAESGRDPGDAEVLARVALERGRVRNSRGEPAAAREDFERAAEGASGADLEFLSVDALHMIAIVVPPEEQADWHRRAISAAEAASDPRARGWLPSLYNNAGWTAFDAGRHDEALELFRRALEERRRDGSSREVGIARWAVARALRALGRVEEALAEQAALRQANAEAGVDDPYVSEELGECLLALGRDDEARPHFAAAAAGLGADQWLAENEPDRIGRLRELGSVG